MNTKQQVDAIVVTYTLFSLIERLADRGIISDADLYTIYREAADQVEQKQDTTNKAVINAVAVLRELAEIQRSDSEPPMALRLPADKR